jgi:hypothetical protein
LLLPFGPAFPSLSSPARRRNPTTACCQMLRRDGIVPGGRSDMDEATPRAYLTV